MSNSYVKSFWIVNVNINGYFQISMASELFLKNLKEYW